MTHDASTIAGGSAPESDEGMSFAEMLAQQEQSEDSRVRLEPGQRVSARVVAVTGDTVFVSTGSKVDGIVDRAELEKDGALSCQVGDSLDLYVITANAQEVKLSRSMSGDGSLAVLEDARDARLPVEGKVSAQVKGGYSVDIMKRRAFCPMSQIDIRPPADPESVLGQTYAFLITKLESHGRNIVVSRRDLLERERGEALTLLLEEMHEGDLREGVVSRLAPFGAFIELAPGVEGMAHLSELSWSRVDHAEDAVKLGDTVRVKVLTIAREAKGVRISLSLKAAMDDPWNTLGDSLATGDTVTGKVVRLTSFGAFVELLPGVEGLVHLSELSFAKRVAKAEEIVSVGDIVSVRIKEIDNDRRRVSLSLKDAAGNPWDNVGDALSVNAEREGSVEKRAPFGLFITLAPGITGLLANQVISASPQRKALEKLNPGDKIMVRIRDIDSVKRRVSLAPAGEEDAAALSEDWKQHAPKKESAPSLGALGLALQAAQAKRKHKPERFSPS